ncbi:MAG: hypothetical protein ACPGED_00855, partial [Flavobacteriales bacterium]
LLLFLAVTFIAKASTTLKSNKEYSKSFNESYSVSEGATLELDSEFSTVEISDWDANKIEVNITVSVDSKSEESAQDFLRKADVDISKSGNKVKVKTEFEGNHNWKHNSFEIHVHIKAPKSCQLNLDHSFGGMKIGSFNGRAEIDSEYGSVDAGSLHAPSNIITIAFGSINIGIFGGGYLGVEYGSAEIDHLKQACTFNNAFSELKILEVDCENGKIALENSYGNSTIGISSQHSFSFETQSSFGDIDLPNGVEYSKKEQDSFSSSKKGSKGSGGIYFEIDNSFGGVEIEYFD